MNEITKEHSNALIHGAANNADIRSLVYVIRGQQVMLDSDLAFLYQVETGALNRAMKRNIGRFPEDFCFQLTKNEYENLKCQFGISSANGYVDVDTLGLLAKKKRGVNVRCYTYANTPLSKQDISKFNAQYATLTVKKTSVFHDRFLILDGKTAYHIGASLKDAGKKCFGISLLTDPDMVKELLNRLKTV